MNPEMMQLYQALMQMQQPMPQMQPPRQSMGMQQPMPAQAMPTMPQQPGLDSQMASAGVNAGVTTGASMINPALGVLAQILMPALLQSLFGKPKQQMQPAQVIPAPR